MDYFTRTYVSGKPYSSQKSFMRARPQTNVKLITTNRSQVNYSSTPQATLRKPYQHDTYNSMPYLFSGYPAVRRNWFDSKVGGQGVGGLPQYKITTMPYWFSARAWGDLDDNSQEAWDALVGLASSNRTTANINFYKVDVHVTTALEFGHHDLTRTFIAFDLRKLSSDDIDTVHLHITSGGYEYLGWSSSQIVIQKSNYNSFIYPSNASVFSNFYGPPLELFTLPTTGSVMHRLSRTTINYLKERAGKIATFCFRDYKYDYSSLVPPHTFFSGFYPSQTELLINHKKGTQYPKILAPLGSGGQKLIPA